MSILLISSFQMANDPELLRGMVFKSIFLVSCTLLLCWAAWHFKLLHAGGWGAFGKPRIRSTAEALWLIAGGFFCLLVHYAVMAHGAAQVGDPPKVIVDPIYLALGPTFAIVLAVIMHATARRCGLSPDLGWSLSQPVKGMKFALIASGIAIPLTISINALMQLVLLLAQRTPSTNALLETLRDQQTPWHELLLGAYLAVIAAPLLEEIVFRGHFQTALTRFAKPPIAIVLVSGLFALIHPETHRPAIFALSICFGLAYERTGKLWVPILMHVIFNALMVTLARLPAFV